MVCDKKNFKWGKKRKEREDCARSGLLLLSVRRCYFINREKLIIERIQLRFSLKFDSKLAGRMMYDWQKIGSDVCRGLVENGQSRILQRIHEGITSNWFLDVADAKSSTDHHLIHLVWRKFPRNRHTAEERRLTAVFTQTEEGSKSLDRQAIEEDCSKILDQQAIERYSGSDLGKLFEAENNTSFSDASSSSDFYSSGSAGRERTSFDYSPENTSFMRPPPKRRSGKPLLIEKKYHPELTNRFECLEVVSPPENSNVNSELKDLELTTVSQGIRPRSPPKTKPKSKIPEIPKTTFAKSCESPLTSAIPTTSTQENVSSNLRRRGIVKWYDPTRMSYGFINMDNKMVFFHVKNVRSGEDHALKPGDDVTFIFDEYDEGVIDVKLLPALSVFPSTSDFPKCEVESHPRDESWETVDSDSENEERAPSGPSFMQQFNDYNSDIKSRLALLEATFEETQLMLDAQNKMILTNAMNMMLP